MGERSYVGEELELFANARNWKTYLKDIISPYLRGTVLEVGAGIGSSTKVLMTGREKAWCCLEPDTALANTLRSELPTLDLPLAPTVRDGTLADISPALRFDTILYIDVLEHIEEDASELSAASRFLRPSGHIVVLSPAHQWLFSPFDAAIGHHRRYSRQVLAAVTPPECEIVQMRYLDSVGVLLSAANRWLLRSSYPTARQIAFWDGTIVPISRVADPLLRWRLGKSIVGVWKKIDNS